MGIFPHIHTYKHIENMQKTPRFGVFFVLAQRRGLCKIQYIVLFFAYATQYIVYFYTWVHFE